MGMGESRGLLPALKLLGGCGSNRGNQLDCTSLLVDAGQEGRALVGTTQVLQQGELFIDYLSTPLLPDFRHLLHIHDRARSGVHCIRGRVSIAARGTEICAKREMQGKSI